MTRDVPRAHRVDKLECLLQLYGFSHFIVTVFVPVHFMYVPLLLTLTICRPVDGFIRYRLYYWMLCTNRAFRPKLIHASCMNVFAFWPSFE